LAEDWEHISSPSGFAEVIKDNPGGTRIWSDRRYCVAMLIHGDDRLCPRTPSTSCRRSKRQTAASCLLNPKPAPPQHLPEHWPRGLRRPMWRHCVVKDGRSRSRGLGAAGGLGPVGGHPRWIRSRRRGGV